MAQPNFFIIGTPKAGTTSLYHYLEEHPDVYMSPIKETNYFSYEDIKAQGLFYNEEHISKEAQYLAQFDGVTTERAIGEASVSYMFYPAVPAKIKAFNSAAKIVAVLRNPVDRGFSHYLMDKRLGFVQVPYETIVQNGTSNSTMALHYQQYVALGLYYEQLKRYFSVFDKAHIQIFLYEEIINDIGDVIERLYRFLEVDATFKPDLVTKHNVFEAPKNPIIQKLYTQKVFRTAVKKVFNPAVQDKVKQLFFSKENKPVLSEPLRANLLEIYKADITKTAALINKDLSSWIK